MRYLCISAAVAGLAAPCVAGINVQWRRGGTLTWMDATLGTEYTIGAGNAVEILTAAR
jgi:hypothetical protein